MGKNISFYSSDSELRVRFFNGFLNFEAFVLLDGVFGREFNNSESLGKGDLSSLYDFLRS